MGKSNIESMLFSSNPLVMEASDGDRQVSVIGVGVNVSVTRGTVMDSVTSDRE